MAHLAILAGYFGFISFYFRLQPQFLFYLSGGYMLVGHISHRRINGLHRPWKYDLDPRLIPALKGKTSLAFILGGMMQSAI